MNAHLRQIESSASLAEIASVIGDEATLRLAEHFGGTRIYVPQKIGAHHPIAVAIGMDAAKLLSEHFFGVRFDLPLRQGQREKVCRLKKDQPRLTHAEIALKVGVNERSVYRWLAQASDDRQGSLFE